MDSPDQITLPPPDAATPDLGHLPHTLGFLLRLAQVEVFGLFHANMAGGLKPGEFSVLYVVGRNPGIRQGVLAEHLRIKRAHMTKLIRAFEQRGLVARRVPEDDRRAVELRLTDAGAALVAGRGASMRAQADREIARLTPAEGAQLIRLLQKFNGIDEEPR